MLSGKRKNAPCLLITTYEGYGDLVYHTPTVRILSKFYEHLDVLCKNSEPFLNNPNIRKLTTFDKIIPKSVDIYRPNIFLVTTDSLLTFPHSSIHTVDLVSIKALRRILRNSEKTLEVYWTQKDIEHVSSLISQHPFATQNKIMEGHFVVISPVKTWESRTLPLSFYQQLIAGIQKRGYGVVLVGKEVVYPSGGDINKALYGAHHFPTAISLYNQLTFAQLCALYSIAPVAINSENGNNPASCTNDFCWNIYIPTLTAPEYRLPHRQGSQMYRTAIAANADDYYPASVYGETGMNLYDRMPVSIPPVEHVLSVFESVLDRITENKNVLHA
jgi:hypothetical protein